MSHEEEADKLGEKGAQFFSSGDYSKAVYFYEQAAKLSKQIGDRENESFWLGNLGISLFMLGELHKAEDCLRQAIIIARERNDSDYEEFLLDKLGAVYHDAGLHSTAVDCLTTGIERARRHGHKENEASLSGNLGNVFSSNGAFHKAVPHYERALQLAKEGGDQKAIGLWLGNLGHNYSGLERYEQAIEHYIEAIEIAKKTCDQDNMERWKSGLEKAQQRLQRKRSAQRKVLDPSTVPGAFVFRGLAARVSQESDLGEKKKLLLSERKTVSDAIKTAIEEADSAYALALIDCIKSLIGRELLVRKRAKIAGIPTPDVVVGGLNPNQIFEPVFREPDLATLTFYYTDDYTFYAFLTFVKDGKPVVEKVVLASRRAGKNYHNALLLLADTKKNRPFDDIDNMLVNLLNDIGQGIIPRLANVKGVKKVLILPFKLLYLLPLHVLLCQSEDRLQVLDEIGTPTYSSSLYNYQLRGKYGVKDAISLKRVLAFIDTDKLSKSTLIERHRYNELATAFEEALGDTDAVNVVTDPEALPNDLGSYEVISWSSHAHSNPTNWNDSHLQAGTRVITAKEILDKWSLDNTITMMLSACETGVDKTIDEEIDEYFGIDMAVHVCGAQTVVSTMWPVEENLAGLVSMSLAEGIAKHQEQPAEFLRLIRFDLLSGKWREKIESNYARLSRTQKKEHGWQFEMLLENDRNSFRNIGSWANYKTFGGW
jgi:tetratricopeptide (TPR) repeat protein